MICIIDCSCSSQEWSVRMVIGSCDLVIFIIKTISKSYNKGEFFSRRHRKKTKSKKKQKKQIFYFFLSQRSHLPFSPNFCLLFLPSSGFLWKCCGLKQQNDLQTLRHFNVKRRKKRSCRGCGGRKHQTGVCFSFSVELPVPTISSWYYCLRQRRTWSGRLCLRSTLETFTQTTQGKKRELNCSPPQGNCWSGAFAKYLRSTSSLTSKLWLGEETVSSVGLSPNCGLVNSEGGTWARTPGRYQLLDHGGTGGDYEDEDTLRDPRVFLLLLCSFLSLSSPHHHFIHQLHWLRLSYVVSNY